jgi:hypothetical protein
MYVPFENLPTDSRIWIYPSNRPFTESELSLLDTKLHEFTSQWAAHGVQLEASYKIVYDRFIILAVNGEVQAASGCSIDASVQFIQSVEAAFGVELLDKMNVTYRTGNYLAHKSLIDFKKMAKDKAVTAETIVFNNLVNTVGEWHEYWEVPAHESWHARFF